jgi:hypothetical protein
MGENSPAGRKTIENQLINFMNMDYPFDDVGI